MPREKVIATCVRLLDESSIRVGSTEYARENETFGVTTLRADHVQVEAGRVRFTFRGKAGRHHDIDVNDPRLAAIIRRLQELPGQTLFHYVDASGRLRSVESGDVNRYLRETTGHDFTAKDFRTWAGTVIAARELASRGRPRTQAEAKRQVSEAVRAVASRLGNTTAASRKFYVHPAVVEGYVTGDLTQACPDEERCERGLLALLERRARSVLVGRDAGGDGRGRMGLDLRGAMPRH
jgi:DNA topoisomerase I